MACRGQSRSRLPTEEFWRGRRTCNDHGGKDQNKVTDEEEPFGNIARSVMWESIVQEKDKSHALAPNIARG
jgi:hypothetical protein